MQGYHNIAISDLISEHSFRVHSVLRHDTMMLVILPPIFNDDDNLVRKGLALRITLGKDVCLQEISALRWPSGSVIGVA